METTRPTPNVTELIAQVHATLQRLIGLHRQLWETCRQEREALTNAALKEIEEASLAKQTIVEAIRQAESQRIQRVADLAMWLKKPIRDLALPNLILLAQEHDAKIADTLRSAFNVLTVLIQRITEQNNDNRALVERSLANVEEMKKNVLGEAVPKSGTYTSRGNRAGVTGGARLISQKA